MGEHDQSGDGKTQTVLLAEDESMIRELIATFLGSLNLNVIEAENGQIALQTAKKTGPESVALLITDLVMPAMGGLELASELRKLHPELRVLFISGYTDDIVLLEKEAKDKSRFLRKPFNLESLRKSVKALLPNA